MKPPPGWRPKVTDFPELMIVPVEVEVPDRMEELEEAVRVPPEVVDTVWPTPKKGNGGAN